MTVFKNICLPNKKKWPNGMIRVIVWTDSGAPRHSRNLFLSVLCMLHVCVVPQNDIYSSFCSLSLSLPRTFMRRFLFLFFLFCNAYIPKYFTRFFQKCKLPNSLFFFSNYKACDMDLKKFIRLKKNLINVM